MLKFQVTTKQIEKLLSYGWEDHERDQIMQCKSEVTVVLTDQLPSDLIELLAALLLELTEPDKLHRWLNDCAVTVIQDIQTSMSQLMDRYDPQQYVASVLSALDAPFNVVPPRVSETGMADISRAVEAVALCVSAIHAVRCGTPRGFCSDMRSLVLEAFRKLDDAARSAGHLSILAKKPDVDINTSWNEADKACLIQRDRRRQRLFKELTS